MADQQNEAGVGNKLAAVRLIAMDVDGVLTDGGILYGRSGDGSEEETKRFHVADGLGIQLAMYAGLTVVWISGRKSPVVERRAKELGVEHLYQECRNKSVPLAQLMATYTLSAANIAYMGDDLNDLPAYPMAGVKFAPANAVNMIKGAADFVTEKAGGHGAVREMIDLILMTQGRLNEALTQYLARLLQPDQPTPPT